MTRRQWAEACLATLFLLSTSRPAPADPFRALADPVVDKLEVVMSLPAGPVAPGMAVLVESWRCWCLSVINMAEEEERQALLSAIATYQMLGVMKAVRMGQAECAQWFAKVRREMEWLEEQHPEFRNADRETYKPADAVAKEWYQYDDLKTFIKYQETRFHKAAQGALDAIAALRERAAKGKMIYVSLAQNNHFLLAAMRKYQEALAEVEWWAEKSAEHHLLSGRDLYIRFENASTDTVFFVQVAARQPDGSYKLREDCAEPAPLYAENPPAALQTVNPKGARGWKRMGYLVNPRDKVIIRAATMGPVRDRIRFMPITGKHVRQDIRSIQRNFWWLGYTADLPNYPAPLVSRWASAGESYQWALAGGWSPTSGSPTKAEVSNSNPKDLACPYEPDLVGDQLSWVLPASRESCLSDGSGAAHVTGEAEFDHLGPQAKQHEALQEKCAGWLRLVVDKM